MTNYPYPGPAPVAAQTNPGQTLGIVGLILGIVLGPLAIIGLILSIIGLRKSKAVGMTNGVALAGIIVSSLFFVGSLIAIAGIVVAAGAAVAAMCSGLEPGVHVINGVTYNCNF